MGAIEGVAGPEAANNSAVTATLAPLLTLGIPTSNTTAILLAAFQNYNLQPGPMLFQTSGDLVWGPARLALRRQRDAAGAEPAGHRPVGAHAAHPHAAAVRRHPDLRRPGAYGIRQSWFDLLLLFVIGLLGMAMRRFDFPTAPVIVGLILGPIAEKQMRNALSISQGDWSVFVTQPISATILASDRGRGADPAPAGLAGPAQRRPRRRRPGGLSTHAGKARHARRAPGLSIAGDGAPRRHPRPFHKKKRAGASRQAASQCLLCFTAGVRSC